MPDAAFAPPEGRRAGIFSHRRRKEGFLRHEDKLFFAERKKAFHKSGAFFGGEAFSARREKIVSGTRGRAVRRRKST